MAGDDLLLGAGIDLAGVRRDSAAVLAVFNGLGNDIAKSLGRRELLPDLSKQLNSKDAFKLLQADITRTNSLFAQFARSADASDSKVVEGIRAMAREQRAYLVTVGASTEQLLKLANAERQFEANVGRAQNRAAAAAAKAAREQAIAIDAMQSGTDRARLTQDKLNTSTGKFSPLAQRAANAAVAIGFGLEGIARGGDAADSGIRIALRSVASFSALFGTTGLIVSGVAASTAAIIDLFNRSRDEVEKTRQKFDDEIRQMGRNADVIGLEVKLQDITIDKSDLERQRAEIDKFLAGFSTARRKTAVVLAALPNASPMDILVAANEVKLKDLRLQIAEFDRQEKILTQKILNPLPAVTRPRGLPTVAVTAKANTKQAEDALERLAKDVATVVGLSKLASTQTIAFPTLPESAVSVFDRAAKAVAQFGSGSDATALKVQQLFADLRDLESVMIGLERRKLSDTGVPDLGPIKVRGLVTEYELAPVDKILPIEALVAFDPSALSKGFRDALKAATAAQTNVDLTRALGDRNAIADAAENATIATANLRREVAAAAATIITSAGTDDQKRAALSAMAAAANAAGIDLAGLAGQAKDARGDTITLAEGVNAIVDAGRGIFHTVDAIGGIGDQARRQISSVLDLVDAVGNLVALTTKGGQTFGKIGAIIGAAGGLVGLVDSLISNPEAKANREIVRGNTQALTRMAQDLAGFSSAVIGQNLAAADAIRDSSILQQRALTSGFSRGFKNVEALDAELRASGTSLAELKRRAEDLGITIVDAKGRITAEGLVALDKALRANVLALSRFRDTLDDFTLLADARNDIFDIPDSAQNAFNDAVDVIQHFTLGLGDGLEGLNISTAEQRERAEKEIRRLFDLASQNLLPPELLNGLTAEEFVRRLVEADNALDDFAETARKAAGEMVNIAEGFAVNRRVFEAIVKSSNGTSGNGTIRTGAPVAATTTVVPVATKTATTATVPLTLNLALTPAQQTGAQVYADIRRTAIDRARTISPTAVAAVQAALPA